jgi:formamidopyrimidine-DNA glycosylase
MPELPEVEITKRGIAPHVTHRTVNSIVVRNPNLRWRVPARLARNLVGKKIEAVNRRAKYLLLDAGTGTLIIHLGMSGSLRILQRDEPPTRHDHVDIVFENGICLRYRDPRRFGCILWSRHPARHRLLRNLGPEPLLDEFDGAYLYQTARRRPGPVKSLLMNAGVVSGIGNIYANEALFAAGIHPLRHANRVSIHRYQRLTDEVKRILCSAIEAGGTTLKDFRKTDGQPGYFGFSLQIYGREGEPCPVCTRTIRRKLTQQRSTYYCPQCQK